MQTLKSEARANPQALARALNLPTPGSSSTLDAISTGITAASLALAPAEIAAELALGTNPVTAIPFIAFDIASLTGLLPSFSGKPKLVDSVQAIQRLAQSSNPAIQQLAQNFAIYARNGVPLSTSNPQQQSQLRTWIAGTIQTILAQRGLPASGSNVSLLDQSIRNVITSEVGNSGRQIDATIAQLGGSSAGAPPTPQPGLSLRPIRSANPGPSIPQPSMSQRSALPALPTSTPSELVQLYTEAAQVLEKSDLANLALCIGAVVVAQFVPAAATVAVRCLEELLARVALQAGRDIIKAIETFVSQTSGGTGARIPSGQPGGTPSQPAPILDQKSDCPGCSPKTRALQKGLRQQEQRTLRDIEREQEQLTEEELSQQEQQLSQIEQLEAQPQSVSQIRQSLQQKQQILQQIQSEENQSGGARQPELTSPGQQPAPALQPSSSQSAQQEIQRELQAEQQVQSFQFCVGCKTQEDMVLFLNGEPSQCSVIPGSTREVNYSA